MLVGLMTDTHENMVNIKKGVEIFNQRNIEILLHCGDIVSPITFNEFKNLNCNIEFVFGNNDGEKVFLVEKFKGKGNFHPSGYSFELAGKKFIMMHEPVGIDALAKSGEYDYILYGHTHKQDIRKIGNSMIINIGETGGWLTGKSCIGILDTEKNEVEIIEL